MNDQAKNRTTLRILPQGDASKKSYFSAEIVTKGHSSVKNHASVGERWLVRSHARPRTRPRGDLDLSIGRRTGGNHTDTWTPIRFPSRTSLGESVLQEAQNDSGVRPTTTAMYVNLLAEAAGHADIASGRT